MAPRSSYKLSKAQLDDAFTKANLSNRFVRECGTFVEDLRVALDQSKTEANVKGALYCWSRVASTGTDYAQTVMGSIKSSMDPLEEQYQVTHKEPIVGFNHLRDRMTHLEKVYENYKNNFSGSTVGTSLALKDTNRSGQLHREQADSREEIDKWTKMKDI